MPLHEGRGKVWWHMFRFRGIVLGLSMLAASLVCVAEADNVFDGLAMWMDIRGDGPLADSGVVGNLLDASSAVPVGGNHETNKVNVVMSTIVPPALPWETNTVRSLRLPQAYDEATGKIMPVALDFPNAAVLTDVQTAYIRFKWDGAPNPDKTYSEWIILNGYDWNSSSGWGVGINNVTGADPARGNFCCLVPQKTLILTWDDKFRISPGIWYDLFLQIEPAVDAASTKFSFFLLKEPSNGVVDGQLLWWMPSFATTAATVPTQLTFSDFQRKLRFGSENTATAFVDGDSNWGAYSKGFRGEIAAFMSWNRALSEEERWQVVRGSFGYDWRFGVPDGSSSDFAADGSSDVLATVRAKTDSAALVQGKLSESSPTLIIHSDVIEREIGLGKVLAVAPLLSDGAEAKVEVSINGEKLGTYDMSHLLERNIVIPGRLWKRGADGLAAIEITRVAPFIGELAFDAITLCGGWKMSGSMTREGYTRSRYTIGAVSPRSIQRGTMISSASKLRTIDIMAHIPEHAPDNVAYSFSFTVAGFGSGDKMQTHSLWVNGTKIAEFPEIAAGCTYGARVPASCLKSGENVFRVSNDASVVAGASRWVSYSGFEIDVRSKRGMVVICR